MSDLLQKEDECSPYVLHSYGFDKAGGGDRLCGDDLNKRLEAEDLAWVHLDASALETREWLERNTPYLDNIIVDALLADETRPRIVPYKEGLLVILRGVNLNEGMEPEDMISIRLWIDENRIVSMQRRRLRAVEDICISLENGTGPRGAGDFLVYLISQLNMRMEPVILQMEEVCDGFEEAASGDPDPDLRHNIVDIRRRAMGLRRYIVPQREVISSLRSVGVSWLDESQKRALQENHDRVTRYVEELDMMRERAQIVKDELVNVMTERMNKNTYTLSIVAAIFLPLGFVTGLLGINVGGMPGADSDVAFWIVCVICAGFSVALLGFLRSLKWL